MPLSPSIRPDIRSAKSWLLLFVLGFGVGPMYPVTTIVMQNVVKPHQLGTATGTLNFFRTLGGAIVVAIFGAIVLGGIGDGPGVTTLEKISAGAQRFGAGLPLGLHRGGDLPRDFIAVPAGDRGAAAARTDAGTPIALRNKTAPA